MKTNIQSPKGFKLRRGSAAAIAIAVSSLFAANASYANTAAGVTLTNSVTVDYDDAGGTAQPQVSASVDVTVDHVPSVAWGTVPADQTTNSGGALPAAYNITLTNTGNGADSYTITDNTSQSCTTGTLTAESFTTTSPVALGGTVISAVSAIGATTITTPDDSNTADGIVRGIANGDTIVIGTDVVTVSGVSENDAGSGNTIVTFAPALTAAAAIGDQVGERTTLVYGNPPEAAGTTSSGATGCDHTHQLNATGSTATGGNTNVNVNSGTWITNVEGVTLAVAKYVRNITNAAKNTCIPGSVAINYNSVDYCASGEVSGNPSDTLEYLVVITNSSAGDATDVEFNDTLPSFTTYTTSSTAVDTNGDETFNITLPGSETEADSEGGIVTQSGSSIQVFAGTGGNENTDLGGGITDVGTAPNNKSAVLYRVTID